MIFNLDQLESVQGEGALSDKARLASQVAEQLIRYQIRNPRHVFEFSGSNLASLAHLAKLESWTGCALVARKFSESSQKAFLGSYQNARQSVAELHSLSPREWKNFLERKATISDLDFLHNVYDISIVIPCYRPGPFLDNFCKNLSHWLPFVREVLVVSDGNSVSDNELLKIRLKDFAKVFLLERPENHGPGVARNLGVEKARSKYISFLDFDDAYDIEILPVVLKAVTNSKGKLFTTHLLKLPRRQTFFAKRFSFPDILFKNQVAVNLFFETEFLRKLPIDGPYNKNLQHHFEDWELNILLRVLGYKPEVIGLPSYQYLIHQQGRQLSPVNTHWYSRKVLSRLFERVPLSSDQTKRFLFLQNLLIQSFAQNEHTGLSSNLFLSRAYGFFQNFQKCLLKLPGGSFVLKVLGKIFQVLS